MVEVRSEEKIGVKIQGESDVFVELGTRFGVRRWLELRDKVDLRL